MPSVHTEIHINAPRSQVWQILIDKPSWKYWNTFLYDDNPKQPMMQGREISLSLLRVPGEEEIQFRPLITLIQPETCVRWISSIPGLRNEHIWELQDLDRDRTQFIYHETFSGPLSKFFTPFIRQDEQKGIRRMAWELKQYAEQPTRRTLIKP